MENLQMEAGEYISLGLPKLKRKQKSLKQKSLKQLGKLKYRQSLTHSDI